MLATVREQARAHPRLAFFSLDVRNAFGTVNRGRILALTAERAPQAAGLLANLWQAGEEHAYVRQGGGEDA
eukprot:6393998-Lingulodinium_polyedra.AAC.1